MTNKGIKVQGTEGKDKYKLYYPGNTLNGNNNSERLYYVGEYDGLSGYDILTIDWGANNAQTWKITENAENYRITLNSSIGLYTSLIVKNVEEIRFKNGTWFAPILKTYLITTTANSINEGSILTTSVATTNVASGAILYYSLTGSGITAADFSSGALSGSGTVGTDGKLIISHTLKNDLITEGSEAVEIKLFSDSSRSTQVGSTVSVTIADASKSETISKSDGKTYAIGTFSDGQWVDTFSEGDWIGIQVNTTNVLDGTVLYFSLSGIGITAEDFTWGGLYGSDSVGNYQSNFAKDISVFLRQLANDFKTEGIETLYIKLFSDSLRTIEVGSKAVSIVDTSLGGQTYLVTPSVPSINEGSILTTLITTTKVASGTILYYSLTGVGITPVDFSSGAILGGSGTVGTDGKFSISHIIANDLTTEGIETLNIKLYSDVSRTLQIGSTASVSIDDTSLTPLLSPTYTITSSATTINEGSILTTSVATTNVASGITLYYSLSGTGITAADFSSGALTGSGTFGTDGKLSISHTLADDLTIEGAEALSIKLYSDAARTLQVGSTATVSVADSSTTAPLVIRGNSIYTIVDGPSWTQAEANSVKLGGHLVAITSVEENQFIYNEFNTLSTGDVNTAYKWIGFTDSAQEGVWRWTNGDTTSFTNWSGPQPDNHMTSPTGQDHAAIQWYGGLFAGDWDDKSDHFSAKGVAETPFIRCGDSAYVIVSGPTWEEAEANAVKLGGHLVTINDAAENNFLYNSFIQPKIGTPFLPEPFINGFRYWGAYWIGLSDKINEGNWQWISGENSNYSNWYGNVGGDDAHGGQDYGVFGWQWSNSWDDAGGPGEGKQEGLYGIAEIRLSTPTPTYTLTPSTSSINEGSTFTTSLATTDVASGTTLYYSLSGTGITAADFSAGALTGSGTVASNGFFSYSHTLANDQTTEGTETLNIKLFSDSSRSTQVGSTALVSIADTSLALTYHNPSTNNTLNSWTAYQVTNSINAGDIVNQWFGTSTPAALQTQDPTDTKLLDITTSSWTEKVKINRVAKASDNGDVIEGKQKETGSTDIVGSVLTGGKGNDRIQAMAGWDMVDGGEGDDLVKTGNGRDILTGGTGRDELWGGFGWNTYKGDKDRFSDLIVIKSDQHLANPTLGNKSGNNSDGLKTDIIENLDSIDKLIIQGVATNQITFANATAQGLTGIGIYSKGFIEALYTGGDLSVAQLTAMTTGDTSAAVMNNTLTSYGVW